MPLFDEEPAKKPRVAHTLGEDLSALSIDELTERIELLRHEIERLQASIEEKKRSRNSAAGFFKI